MSSSAVGSSGSSRGWVRDGSGRTIRSFICCAIFGFPCLNIFSRSAGFGGPEGNTIFDGFGAGPPLGGAELSVSDGVGFISSSTCTSEGPNAILL